MIRLSTELVLHYMRMCNYIYEDDVSAFFSKT
jgi:hypothetical protein